ncbi:UDP-2,4-diacetamido-2,4,6-trideoxy-beta-L-altropyranose hydrolase [Profundibacter sp.]
MTNAVVFRCNVSASVGVGHLMRCREMARYLQGLGIASAILGPPENLKTAADNALFDIWQSTENRSTSEQDAARVLALCDQIGARHLVMDDYRIDPPYQQILRSNGLRWMQQFDASKPWEFSCDILVNSSPYERRADYLPWLKYPAKTQTLFGPAYAVLRPAFTALSLRDDGRGVRRILVGFGGGDDRGAIDMVLDALAGNVAPTLVIVSGNSNPQATAIAQRVASLPAGQAEFHLAPDDMAGLMAGCDLAIIGGGTMSYEAAICGLPLVFIGLAPNQERPCQGWHDLTGAPYLGRVGEVGAPALYETVTALIGDDEKRHDMAARGRKLVDGRGTGRLVNALLEREKI